MPERDDIELELGVPLNAEGKLGPARKQESAQVYGKLKSVIKAVVLILIVLCMVYSAVVGKTSVAEAAVDISKITSIIAAASLEWREGNRSMWTRN